MTQNNDTPPIPDFPSMGLPGEETNGQIAEKVVEELFPMESETTLLGWRDLIMKNSTRIIKEALNRKDSEAEELRQKEYKRGFDEGYKNGKIHSVNDDSLVLENDKLKEELEHKGSDDQCIYKDKVILLEEQLSLAVGALEKISTLGKDGLLHPCYRLAKETLTKLKETGR